MKKKKAQKKKNILPKDLSFWLKGVALRCLGFLLLCVGFILLISFLFYDGQDASFDTVTTVSSVHNVLGHAGAFCADAFLQFLGLGALVVVLVLFSWGGQWLKNLLIGRLLLRIAFIPIMLTALCGALAMISVQHSPEGFRLGGVIGDLLISFLPHGMSLGGFIGVSFAFWFVFFVSFLFVMALTLGDWRIIFGVIAWALGQICRILWRTIKGVTAWCIFVVKRWIYGAPRLSSIPYNASLIQKKRQESSTPFVASSSPSYHAHEDDDGVDDLEQNEEEEVWHQPVPLMAPSSSIGYTDKISVFYDHDYQRPDLKVFGAGDGLSQEYSVENFREQVDNLQKVLKDFGIEGRIHQVHPGPVVTLYEFEPAPGIKSSRIIGLGDDIARGMGALSVRIGVIPGQKVLGIEIPQGVRRIVRYRDVLENSLHYMETLKLPMVLGLDIGGQPQVVDLALMPHLLMAGTTGSGKSVGLNAMILSMLYMLSPQQCRFIMIDPKMLELSVYNDIPHLLTPVVTDPKKAVVALKWAVKEMEDRYQLMSKMSVRNIEGYNNKVAAMNQSGEVFTRTIHIGFDDDGRPQYEEEQIDLKPLPYIVVIIDEMADLMMVSGKDIEASVQRLAQMARAAGIHLITATQRPSVDVITGTIKANFVHRISFKVTSKIDSRTILGEMGAEQLLGKGDMLYLSGGGSLKRIHGPFIEDSEVEAFCNDLRARYAVHYEMSVSKSLEKDDAIDEDEDALYDEAVALVMQEKRASTSFIQRYFKIGYNRAARLVESMERRGIVSEPDGSGRRQVLIEE